MVRDVGCRSDVREVVCSPAVSSMTVAQNHSKINDCVLSFRPVVETIHRRAVSEVTAVQADDAVVYCRLFIHGHYYDSPID